MLDEVKHFEELLTTNFEIEDLQAVEIVIAAAVSHKAKWSEMLWLRIIGASGSGKTELLRTLSFEPYAVTMESITAGAIRRGFVVKKNGVPEQTLMQRLDGKLVITKEFGTMLTKNTDALNEIFGLLRSVYDGQLDADYGSEEGHLHQSSHFDWILGTTSYIDSNRSIEYQLGSRFVDLRWESPLNRLGALDKAQDNDGRLEIVRGKLARAMADIIESAPSEAPKLKLPYVSPLANIAASMRSPVSRDRYSREIDDVPDIELGTRMAQALSRMARGLLMIGVNEYDIKPYLNRLVFSSMNRIRAKVISAWMDGLTKQTEIAARTELPQGSISRTIDDIMMVGWKDEWLSILNGDKSRKLSLGEK